MKDGITDLERWMYFFAEGKNVDVDNPPEILCTDEMRQAMAVLNRFSENEDDYLLYQSRLNAISKEDTYVSEDCKDEEGKDLDDVVAEVSNVKPINS